jgi:ABC-type branched-subunit amino acid transport system substrate-binding protein
VTRRTRTVAVLLAAMALVVTAACGQKSGVHVSSGDRSLDGGGGGTAAPSTTAGGGDNGGIVGPELKGPDSATGVSDTEIRIGIHGPLTGAGAPAESFLNAASLYFDTIGPAINGRSVKVFLEDDKYNPSGAVAACKKLVAQDKVFLILGAAGADQIAACAKYADGVGVPYLSEGISKSGFDNLSTYWALSLTYGQQGKILAEYMKNVVKAKKVAMVRANTANFAEAHTEFVKAAKANGLDVVKDLTVPKDAGQGEVQSAAVQLCGGSRPDAVFPLLSPAIFLQLAGATHSQNCDVRWAGVGNTMAINLVAAVGCGSKTLEGGASFFASYPALDKADELDPNYQKAYQAKTGKAGDDIGFGLWAAEKGLGELLKAGGKNLTRHGFMKAISGKRFPPTISPGVDFTSSRFGGTAVHVQKVDCAAQPPAYKTEFMFKSDF